MISQHFVAFSEYMNFKDFHYIEWVLAHLCTRTCGQTKLQPKHQIKIQCSEGGAQCCSLPILRMLAWREIFLCLIILGFSCYKTWYKLVCRQTDLRHIIFCHNWVKAVYEVASQKKVLIFHWKDISFIIHAFILLWFVKFV